LFLHFLTKALTEITDFYSWHKSNYSCIRSKGWVKQWEIVNETKNDFVEEILKIQESIIRYKKTKITNLSDKVANYYGNRSAYW
jgi:hypothetical protein